jgi:hypothetical protein
MQDIYILALELLYKKTQVGFGEILRLTRFRWMENADGF